MSEQIKAIKSAKTTPIADYLKDRVVGEMVGTKKFLSPNVSFLATVAGGLVATAVLTTVVSKLTNSNN